MLDWTGERFVPWAKEPAVAYEHLHRYIWASSLVPGKRVLDLASGEGYGSNLLAERAASVVGIDIDEAAVHHAAQKYAKSNLEFLKGSITAVPLPENGTFDVIVCFEAIEHIEDQESLLREVRRLLKPDGIFIVSTPNKGVYDSGNDAGNPFHVKELTFDEFNALLTRHFAHVNYLGQRTYPASSLWPLDRRAGPSGEFTIERQNGEFRSVPNHQRIPEYFVAVASPASNQALESTVLVDQSNELVNELMAAKNRALEEKDASAREVDEAKLWFEGHRREFEAALKEKDEALDWRQRQLDKLNEDIGWARGQMQDLKETVASRDEALAWRTGQVESLENQKAWLSTQLQNTQNELKSVYQSRGWKWVLKMRGLRARIKKVTGL